MSPGARPTSVPSGILIHPTVRPQYTSVSVQTGQTGYNGPVAYGVPLRATVAQNTAINDARLAPTPKPEVEIRRKPHKRTRSTRHPIQL